MNDISRLGFWPAVTTIYHCAYRCSGQALAALQLEGCLPANVLAACLANLQHRHPLLQARIVQADGGFKYDRSSYVGMNEPARLSGVPLRVCKRRGPECWRRIAEEEIDRDASPDSACLWRAVFITEPRGEERSELILLFHHAICDGLSMTRFIHDLLNLCSVAIRSKEIPPRPEPLPLLPPPESMIRKTAPEKVCPPPVPAGSQTAALPYEQPVPLERRSTKILFLTLDENLVRRVRERCRRENTTVNSAFSAALVRAVTANQGRRGRIPLSTGLNLRPCCEPQIGPEHFGCYIMMVQSFHDAGLGIGFWDAARACRTEIEREIFVQQRRGFMPRTFHRAFLESAMRDNVARANNEGLFTGGAVLSNLGVLDYPDSYTPVSVRGMYCVTSQLSGLYMLFLGVYTLFGKLFCSLSYPAPLLSAASAASIAERFQTELEQACAG